MKHFSAFLILISNLLYAEHKPVEDIKKLPSLKVEEVCINNVVYYKYKDWTTAFGDRGYFGLSVKMSTEGNVEYCVTNDN